MFFDCRYSKKIQYISNILRRNTQDFVTGFPCKKRQKNLNIFTDQPAWTG
jgi:hypothetical protein